MRPDLFAGPAQRDNSHRILARLANGGSLPAPGRHWIGWSSAQRARMAALIALLAGIAAAWVWLQDYGRPPSPPAVAPPQAAPGLILPARAVAAYPPTPQAATIVNEPARPAHAAPASPQPPAIARSMQEPRLARTRPARATPAPRGQRSDAPAEGDEDVTLLAAMLKHANAQKPASTQPKD